MQTLFPNYLQEIASSLQHLAADGGPLPEFHVEWSNITFNAVLFIALDLSLLGVLAATTIERWASAHLQIFQRYRCHPLGRARVRQFFYKGMKKWGLHHITTIPPASVLSTLFLLVIVIAYHFFHVNITIAIITTTAAIITSALYIWSMITPIQDPQSLYQSPLSELTWQVIQMTSCWTRRYTGGPRNHTRTNMMDAHEQLAMDKSDDHRNWDARVICSMIEGLTEESKLETFVNSIPGTFNSWGQEVWGIIAAEDKRAGVSTPQPNAETDVAV